MRRPKRRWKVAVLAGAVAFAPVAGLNLLLWLHINTNAREDISDAASSMLRLTEARLDEAMTQLVALSMKAGHTSCGPDVVKALSQALLKAPDIADISISDPSGAAVCSPSGQQRIVRAVSPVNDTAQPRVKLVVVDFGRGGEKSLQLNWRFADGWTTSALVPGDKLLPPVVVGRLQADFISRLSLVDGTAISSRLSHSDMSIEGSAAFDARIMSERYPLALSVFVPSSALWTSYRQLFVWGNAGGVLLALVSIMGALAVSRQMAGPERDIENSIRRGEFIPYYQPVMCIRTGKLLGCEALVRRRRPDGKVEGPGAFISMVEATGQIYEITRSLMAQARDELAGAYGPRPHLKVSFNLVADHFADDRIVDDVRQIFEGAAVRTSQVVLEVTERHALPDLASARVIIAKLQHLGARVAIDDVGTGHGGMSYLLKLGVDQMKMDKMFVDAIGTDRYSTAIIDTLIKLAEDLNMEFVAEGVETFEQIAYLRERGVSAAQGYVFAPPLPGPLFLELIAATDPVAAELPSVKKAIRGAERTAEAA